MDQEEQQFNCVEFSIINSNTFDRVSLQNTQHLNSLYVILEDFDLINSLNPDLEGLIFSEDSCDEELKSQIVEKIDYLITRFSKLKILSLNYFVLIKFQILFLN